MWRLRRRRNESRGMAIPIKSIGTGFGHQHHEQDARGTIPNGRVGLDDDTPLAMVLLGRFAKRPIGNRPLTWHSSLCVHGETRRIAETWSKSGSTLTTVLRPLRNIVATWMASRTESLG